MNTKENILISIAMAVYNGERFIEAQIKSIQSQTYGNWELIICDDGSTDRSGEIIRALADVDSRIQYHLNTSKLGLNKNFEKAIHHCHGTFIAICDQDDLWRKDKIEKLVELMDQKNVVLVHGQSVRFTNQPPTHITSLHKRNMLTGQKPIQSLYFNTIAGHNILFRKSLLHNRPSFPEGIYYDWWLVMLASCTGKIQATAEVLTWHRHHEGNVTLGKKDEKRQTKSKAAERLQAIDIFLQQLPLDGETKNLALSIKEKLNQLEKNNFSFSLFLLLVKHASSLFFFKKNKLPYFSYLKICYRMSWAI